MHCTIFVIWNGKIKFMSWTVTIVMSVIWNCKILEFLVKLTAELKNPKLLDIQKGKNLYG